MDIIGNEHMFQLLCRVANKSRINTTRAMMMATGGCIVQSTIRQQNPDGSYAVARALVYVPGAEIVPDVKGGKRII